MSFLNFLLDFVKQNNETKSPEEKGNFRHWRSPKGNDYVKQGGKGRQGKTWIFRDNESGKTWWR